MIKEKSLRKHTNSKNKRGGVSHPKTALRPARHVLVWSYMRLSRGTERTGKYR